MKTKFICGFLVASMVGCGAGSSATKDDDGTDGDPASETSGVASFGYDLADGASGETTFDNAVRCYVNPTDSTLVLHVANTSYGDALLIDVEGLRRKATTYNCKQAGDNAVEIGSLGDGFEGCSVEARLGDGDSGSAYSMYRASVHTSLFTYSRDCKVTVTTTEPRVTGSFACKGLVQTFLDGYRRNPIDDAVTGDFTGKFDCLTNVAAEEEAAASLTDMP